MDLSQSIISLLESGKRRWTENEFCRFVAAVDTIKAESKKGQNVKQKVEAGVVCLRERIKKT